MCAVYNTHSGTAEIGQNGALSGDIASLSADILDAGHQLRFHAPGGSMRPFIRPGDILEIHPRQPGQIPPLGAVVLSIDDKQRVIAHRVVRRFKELDNLLIVTQGDALVKPDAPIPVTQVLGIVIAIMRGKRRITIQQDAWRALGIIWLALAPLRPQLIHLWRAIRPMRVVIRQKLR